MDDERIVRLNEFVDQLSKGEREPSQEQVANYIIKKLKEEKQLA